MKIKFLKTITSMLLITLLSACSNNKSTFDFDSSADFSSIKTYQLDKQPTAFSKDNPLVDKRIIKAIEDNMGRKGISTSAAPDIIVSYRVQFEKKVKSGGLSVGVGVSVGKNNRGRVNLNSGNRVKQTVDGSLMVSMVSVNTKELIWRATTTQPVSGRNTSAEDSEKRIGQLVFSMFENFPPKK